MTPEEAAAVLPELIRATERYKKRLQSINGVMHKLATEKRKLAFDWAETVHGLGMQPINPIRASVLISTTNGDYVWEFGQEGLGDALNG